MCVSVYVRMRICAYVCIYEGDFLVYVSVVCTRLHAYDLTPGSRRRRLASLTSMSFIELALLMVCMCVLVGFMNAPCECFPYANMRVCVCVCVCVCK
jgi:hypothetical protein